MRAADEVGGWCRARRSAHANVRCRAVPSGPTALLMSGEAADRWLPTSHTCSECGRVDGPKPLDVRTWACPCVAAHDRDCNAAKNILAAGAGGEAIRLWSRRKTCCAGGWR